MQMESFEGSKSFYVGIWNVYFFTKTNFNLVRFRFFGFIEAIWVFGLGQTIFDACSSTILFKISLMVPIIS